MTSAAETSLGKRPKQTEYYSRISWVLNLFENANPPEPERQYVRDKLTTFYLALGGNNDTTPKHVLDQGRKILDEVVVESQSQTPGNLFLASTFAVQGEGIMAAIALDYEKNSLSRGIKAMARLVRLRDQDFKIAVAQGKNFLVDAPLLLIAQEIIERGRKKEAPVEVSRREPPVSLHQRAGKGKRETTHIDSQIGARIKNLRTALGLSQAAVLGKESQVAISTLERGVRKLTPEMAGKIASKFGITAEDLLNGGPNVDSILGRVLWVRPALKRIVERPASTSVSSSSPVVVFERPNRILVPAASVVKLTRAVTDEPRLPSTGDLKKIDYKVNEAVGVMKKKRKAELILSKQGDRTVILLQTGKIVERYNDGTRERNLNIAEVVVLFGGIKGLSSVIQLKMHDLDRGH